MRKVRGVSPAGDMRKSRFERWLAAVLIADVVGYTCLIERDEADAHARVTAVQRELLLPHVKRRGGRVVKTTGDGVVAEFRSSLDAAVCAVLVQKAMLDLNKDVAEEDRIVLRMGLNAGEVIHDEGDIYGKTVIVAARLQALSPAGGICVSRAVRDHLRDKVPLPLADLGEKQLKNLVRPLRAFEIRAEAIASTVFDAEPAAGKAGSARHLAAGPRRSSSISRPPPPGSAFPARTQSSRYCRAAAEPGGRGLRPRARPHARARSDCRHRPLRYPFIS